MADFRALDRQVAGDFDVVLRVVFQLWDWRADGRVYTVHLFMLQEAGRGWRTTHAATRYRALLRDELGAIRREAGFADIHWRLPEGGGYVQPLVTARKR